jgi:glycerophosphoryl diester phosphodiesterase
MRPLVLAHRARQGHRHPENSLAALRAVLRGRTDGVEIDVRRSADGAYFIHHDPAFADGTPVESLSAQGLRKRRLSNGEPIPTLEEFLRAATRGLVFLDLKETCVPVEVADRALTVLPPERLFFSSFWHPGIRELGRRRPTLRRGVTLEARLVAPEKAMTEAGASVLVLPASCADRATVTAVRKAGGEVWCWGFRTGDATSRALVRRGVAALIPD